MLYTLGFCNDYTFDAKQTSQGDVYYNFRLRMQHIYDHFMHDYAQPEEMQKDGHFIKHLLKHNLIDRDIYESVVSPTKLPPFPSTQDRHRRHNSHRSYRPNIVVEISNGQHQHGSEHLREQIRHRSKSGRRNRDGHEALYPVPADPLDEVVLRTRAQQRSSLHSSSMMAESTSLEGLKSPSSNIACRRSASKHSDDKSISYMGDETAANNIANQLHKLDTRLVGERSIHSPWRVESPLSQDHSHVRLSRCATFTSTPESGSFWLAEYSEDEDRKLEEDHPFFQFRSLAVASTFGAFQSWQANRSEDVQCDGVGESDPTSNRDKGKDRDSASGKRTWSDHSESGKNVTESSGPSSNRVDCSKRRRTSDRQLTFACPYTKKDSMSYRDCYKYRLSRIRDVKQHLARCHRNPPYCPRCMGTFETEEERDEHIREFSCPSRPLLRLDGITEAQKSQLAKKSMANTTPEDQWYAVFDIVFPGHKPRPRSAYVDSELLQDITLYQDFLTSHGPRILSEVLTQRGAVTWNSPDDERDLAAFQQSVFEEGLGIVFEHWLARRSNSNSRATDVPSSSGSTSQLTPPSSSYSRERLGSTSVQDPRAVVTESSNERPVGGLTDAHLDSEDVQEASADQMSFGEELDGSYILEHGNSDFLSGLTYDGSDDELTRFFMDG